jgi:hypothetical protein
VIEEFINFSLELVVILVGLPGPRGLPGNPGK